MPITRPEIFITPDFPTVKFREDPETINLAIEVPKILAQQGWGLGTIFCIQFINHERTKLIKLARFIVSSENESLHTFNPDSERPMTKLIQAREARQMEAWFYPNPEVAAGTKVNWNVGAKEFQVKRGDKVLFSSKDREEAEKFKEAA